MTDVMHRGVGKARLDVHVQVHEPFHLLPSDPGQDEWQHGEVPVGRRAGLDQSYRIVVRRGGCRFLDGLGDAMCPVAVVTDPVEHEQHVLNVIIRRNWSVLEKRRVACISTKNLRFPVLAVWRCDARAAGQRGGEKAAAVRDRSLTVVLWLILVLGKFERPGMVGVRHFQHEVTCAGIVWRDHAVDVVVHLKARRDEIVPGRDDLHDERIGAPCNFAAVFRQWTERAAGIVPSAVGEPQQPRLHDERRAAAHVEHGAGEVQARWCEVSDQGEEIQKKPELPAFAIGNAPSLFPRGNEDEALDPFGPAVGLLVPRDRSGQIVAKGEGAGVIRRTRRSREEYAAQQYAAHAVPDEDDLVVPLSPRVPDLVEIGDEVRDDLIGAGPIPPVGKGQSGRIDVDTAFQRFASAADGIGHVGARSPKAVQKNAERPGAACGIGFERVVKQPHRSPPKSLARNRMKATERDTRDARTVPGHGM